MSEELRCSKCGIKTEAHCTCHKPYKHIPAREAAALGIAAHPDWSNYKIAEAVGVDESTVRLLRQPTTGNPVVGETRIGRDGRRQGPRRRPQEERAREAVRERVQQGEPVRARQLAEEIGVSHVIVEAAARIEQELHEAEPVVTRDMLSPSAQQRFDTAIRQYQRTLDAQFRQRVRDDVSRLIRELAEPRLREREADAERIINSRRHGIFTQEEYNSILRCLHPDLNPTIEQKNEAFRLWHERKLLLLSNTDDPRTYSELPSVDELRRAYARR